MNLEVTCKTSERIAEVYEVPKTTFITFLMTFITIVRMFPRYFPLGLYPDQTVPPFRNKMSTVCTLLMYAAP